MRQVLALPGRTGWANAVVGYGLPEGLTHKQPVRVVAKLAGTMVRVMTEEGRHFDLQWWLVDCGQEVRCADGEYRFESDPRALAELEEIIRCRRAEDPRCSSLASTGWILRRNGREPGGDEDLEDEGFVRNSRGG